MTDTAASRAPRPRSWVAPLLSTVATLGLGLIALLFVALSPMACDSCYGAESDRFDESFETAFAVFCWGLLAPVVLLVLSWWGPRPYRGIPLRGLLAVAAPAAVGVDYLVFLSLVDWP